MKKYIERARPAEKPSKIKKTPTGFRLDQPSLAKQNIRTLMQAFCGCRRNCAECKADEAKWAEELIPPLKCSYDCCFTAIHSQVMEQHYQRKHYPKAKEVHHA